MNQRHKTKHSPFRQFSMPDSRSISLYVMVFMAGFCILALEIIASKILAPYFGTTVEVWGLNLSVVLFAMALGYFLGGKVADNPRFITSLSAIISYSIWAAGAWLIALALFSDTILVFLLKVAIQYSSQQATAILAASLLLFTLPVLVLSFISPLILKIVVRAFDTIGNKSGNLSAIGTLGSIIGSLATVLWLLPYLGITLSLFSLAFLLWCVDIYLQFSLRKTALMGALGVIVVLLMPTLSRRQNTGNIIFAAYSPYQYIQVEQRNNRTIVRVDKQQGLASISPADSGKTGVVFDYFAAAPQFITPQLNQPIDVLILGLAGGTAVRQIRDLYPDQVGKIVAYEIDPLMIDIAQNYFGVTAADAEIVAGDARYLLHTHARQQFDLIIVDAFANGGNLPEHLATQEFYQLLEQKLTSRGIVVMNIISRDQPESLIRHVEQTALTVFPAVLSVNTVGDKPASRTNHIVYASRQPLNLDANPLSTSELKELVEYIRKHGTIVAEDSSILVFTDDLSPVNHYQFK